MSSLTQESLDSLLTTSRVLHNRLFNSPIWALVKDEPFIVNWVRAINEVESQLEKDKGAKAAT